MLSFLLAITALKAVGACCCGSMTEHTGLVNPIGRNSLCIDGEKDKFLDSQALLQVSNVSEAWNSYSQAVFHLTLLSFLNSKKGFCAQTRTCSFKSIRQPVKIF